MGIKVKKLLNLFWTLLTLVFIAFCFDFDIVKSPICKIVESTGIDKCYSYHRKKCYDEKDINVCKYAGMLYEKDNDWRGAASYYAQACNLGSGSMCFKTGSISYRFGLAFYNTRELWEKSCELEYSDGCLMLGKLYEDGKLVRQNLYKAEELYNKACKLYLRQNPNIIGCNAYYNKRLAEFGF